MDALSRALFLMISIKSPTGYSHLYPTVYRYFDDAAGVLHGSWGPLMTATLQLWRRACLLLVVLAVTLVSGCTAKQTAEPPLVLAAASLQESMNAAADAFAAKGHPRPVLSFAASSALARQIQSGAEADLFISADQEWMDSVQVVGRTQSGTRRNLVGNALVLVAPHNGPEAVSLTVAGMDRALGDGRLAMADPASVPAGRYGKAALQSLNLWSGVEDRIASSENVRAALALVERQEAPLGIVYATDAQASGNVRVVATIPHISHEPIVYPMALLAGSKPDAQKFYRFLLSSEGQAIFTRYGFGSPRR